MIKRNTLIATICCSALPLAAQTSEGTIVTGRETANVWQDADYDEAFTDSIMRNYMLEEVVVTGTRTPKLLKDTPIQTRLPRQERQIRMHHLSGWQGCRL